MKAATNSHFPGHTTHSITSEIKNLPNTKSRAAQLVAANLYLKNLFSITKFKSKKATPSTFFPMAMLTSLGDQGTGNLPAKSYRKNSSLFRTKTCPTNK